MGAQRTSGPEFSRALTDQRNLQAVFGRGSAAVGAVAGLVVYGLSASWSLAIFVFLIGQYTCGRAVCDLITDPDRNRRAFYFAVLPVVAIGFLVGAYQVWDTMWLAVLIGLVGGWVAQQVIGILLVHDIWEDERADDLQHAREVFS